MPTRGESIRPGAPDPGAAYGPGYYESHCGPIPCSDSSPVWREHNERVAEAIVRGLAPRRVFDAGCSEGLLVSALVDRNVDADGRDISTYAIGQVRDDVRSHCSVGSIADPIQGRYDLVVCIEVLEHMPEPEALRAVTSLTDAAPRVLFSSTPADFDEPTHVNVHPLIYWLRLFAQSGFAPVPQHDATYVCPHAMLLEARTGDITEEELFAFAELVRLRMQVAESREAETRHALASERAARDAAQADLEMRLVGAEATASNALSQLLEVESLLSRYLDDEADPSRPIWVRRLWRRLAPMWLRSVIVRGARFIGWALTLRVPRHLLRRRARLAEGARVSAEQPPPDGDEPAEVGALLGARFSLAGAIATFRVPDRQQAVSIIVEDLRSADLMGPAGTAVILGSLLAECVDARLRVVTRRARGQAADVAELLVENGLPTPGDIELVYAPVDSAESIAVGPSDAFLTTSWQSSQAILPEVAPGRVIQMLEDDERLRYGIGDERLRCLETLSDPRLRLLTHGRLLLDSLCKGSDALAAVAGRIECFEPAFPQRLFHRNAGGRRSADRRTLLFIAESRGGGPLFWRGLEALSLAGEEGILNRDEWKVVLAGEDLPMMRLPGGILPELAQDLTISGFAAVLRQADLGLSLGGTPSLGLSSLRLIASGVPVVTDARVRSNGSPAAEMGDVVPSELDVRSLRRSLEIGMSLVRGDSSKVASAPRTQLPSDWRTSLEIAISRCAEWIGPR